MIQRIKGTMDILPDETPLFRYIEGVMREEAEKYGYGEIRTPTIENTELFVRGYQKAEWLRLCSQNRLAASCVRLQNCPRRRS